ncbi:MAG: hypothetical protein P1P80_07860, partial [ANME-2 cluster archaeon]|nr:hypothetical protein [ANME-2 cluster archaeon]
LSITIIITLLLLIFGPLILFPQNLILHNGSEINIKVHYIGYFFGIFVPILFENLLFKMTPEHPPDTPDRA